MAGVAETGCQEPWVTSVSHHYTNPSNDQLVLVQGAILSFESLESPGLQPEGECGFGLQSELLPESLFEVDLAMYEAFCERYADATAPPGIKPEDIFGGNQVPKFCENNLRYLSR